MKNFKKTIIVFIALCQTFMLVSCGKEPIEMVNIPGQNYKMSTTEITQKLYESIMGENPSHFKGENNPVEMVSWYDAIYFCNKLSKKCGYAPVYSVSGTTDVTKWNYTPHQEEEIKGEVTQNTSADGFRLPTNSDWVYAAKGGQNYKYAGSNNIDEVAWCGENSNGTTHPVAQKKANGYGLYDMTGNVWEWCWNSDDSDNRYIRGGDWCSSAVSCTVSDRDLSCAYSRYDDSGFRVVRTVKSTQKSVKKKIVKGKDPIEMVNIPGQNYKMSTTEVTQGLYESIMGTNPSHFKGENNPVERVSWYDAIYFCNKLSEKCGYTPVYSVGGTTDVTKWNYTPHQGDLIEGYVTRKTSADGFRLPTEAEWVYAAKGGQNYKYAGSDNIYEVAWYKDNSGETTHPVAQKKANGYGLYDMTGNVCEWCWDSYDFGLNRRYVRGGSWNYSEDYCTVSYWISYYAYCRYYDYAYFRNYYDGFRVVRTAESIQKSVEKKIVKGKEPIEMVNIPGQNYKMSTTEVTQGLYESIMGENPSYFNGENNPVEMVSWYDAIYFCNKLSEKCGYTPVYSVGGTTDVTKWNYTPHQGGKIEKEVARNTSANGFRLPTEAEWVYAAKGGQNYKYAGSDNIYEVAWYKDNSGETTHPVAQKKANGYGLYDMTGNEWEWCWDSNGSGYRYFRGGSWNYSEAYCTVSYGLYRSADYRSNYRGGIRVVRTAK